MRNPKVAARYAQALIELAKEQGIEDVVLTDLNNIFTVCKQNKELQLVLDSPIIKSEKKASIFSSIFNGKVNPITSSFLGLIFKKGREVFLADIIEAYQNVYNKLKQIHPVKVVSAVPLQDRVQDILKGKIQNFYNNIGSVNIESSVDSTLLGGFTLQIGDLLFDASVANKLKEAKRKLTGVNA